MTFAVPRLPPGVIAACLLAIGLAGCGGSGSRASHAPAVRSVPTDAGPAPAHAGPVTSAAGGWPALLHGPSHFGAATVTGPQTAHVRWRRSLGAPIVAGPVTTDAGVAYIASGGGALHAIDVSSGRDRWRFNGGGSYGSDLSTAPLLLGDGRVIWPGPRHRLFGLSSAGRLLWTLAGEGDLLTPLLDQPARLLLVADQTGRISGYRLRPGSGAPIRVWSVRLASSSFGSPALAADGTIYETAGNALFALTPQGRIRWKVDTPSTIETSPAVADAGIVVFGSNDEREYGVDPSGHIRWRVVIGNYTYSSPLTLAAHRVIFGNHSGQMTVLDSGTGRLISRDQGQGQLWTAAAVDNRGDAYFASRTGQIFGFDAAGRRLFDLSAGGTFDSYPALAPDGTLLVGADNGTLYAFR